MTKPSSGVYAFAIGETSYRFTSHVLCIQSHEIFATHFSSHQFGVTTKGGCEIIIHGIKCNLDLHLDMVIFQLTVANVVNSMLKWVIFQKFHVVNEDIIQLIPFFHAFYEFEIFVVLQLS
jgi:hypothetical protein